MNKEQTTPYMAIHVMDENELELELYVAYLALGFARATARTQASRLSRSIKRHGRGIRAGQRALLASGWGSELNESK